MYSSITSVVLLLVSLSTMALAQAPATTPTSTSSSLARETDSGNSIQLLRNATMKIRYAGKTFLTDPMLSSKGTIRSFAGIASNPTIDLPIPVNEVLAGIDHVLVSHLHPDHFDEVTAQALPRTVSLLCRTEEAASFTAAGFTSVHPIKDSHQVGTITITRIGGQHGKGKILERLGTVAGFVFKAPGQPTVYWVGDSIWCDEVEQAIKTHTPDVIITHSGGAILPGFEPIIMDVEQTFKVMQAAPQATIVAIHMESLDHCPVTRLGLREEADKRGIPAARLQIPVDGGEVTF